ncbi:MAG: major capsid protein [Microviridae sp.]|nr:MAG: major capsid protein [Microviridae sp.]
MALNNVTTHPEVDSPEPSRGFHDLSFNNALSFAPGTIHPLCSQEIIPGDSLSYGISGRLESFPMIAPLLNGFKYRNTWHFVPLSNFYGYLDGNVKIKTSEYISNCKFWSYIPCCIPGSVADVVRAYPSSNTDTLPASAYAWMDPNVNGNINNSGVARGTLLNYLGTPIGTSGAFPTRTAWTKYVPGDTVSEVSKFADGLTVNAHDVLAYMDAVRASYADLQQDKVYYLACGVDSDIEILSAAGRSIYFDAPQSVYRYKYKYVTIQSLDNFFMAIRSYTTSPTFKPNGTTGTSSTLDLSNSILFADFVNWCSSYLVNIAGNQPGVILDSSYDACSALRYFLEVLGISAQIQNWSYYKNLYKSSADFVSCQITPHLASCGVFLTTYEMDLNRGLLSTSVGNTKSVVDTSSGSFSIDVFRFRNSVQKTIDKFDISGGRFSSWLRRIWSVKSDSSLDVAQLLHVTSSYIGNTDIISTSSTSTAALAQQAGYTIGTLNSQEDHFTSDSPGVLLCLGSLVPVVSYSQGMSPYKFRLSLSDTFQPDYANIGFQDVPLKYLDSQLCTSWSVTSSASNKPVLPDPTSLQATSTLPDTVVARRPAWQDYRANVDVASGSFGYGGELSYWTLPRIYTPVLTGNPVPGSVSGSGIFTYLNRFRDGFLSSISTYVFPRLYNYLFAQTDDSAQNFRLNAHITIKGTRPVPAPYMPSL